MKIAYRIPETPQGFAGWRRGFALSEPYRHTDHSDETYDWNYVVVSSGREHVQAFGANERGVVIDWSELTTHPLGTDAEAVLAALGYEVSA